MRRTLLKQFFAHERLQTTRARAMAIRGDAERLITLARNSSKGTDIDKVNARRLAASRLGDAEVVKKLFDDIAPRFSTRPGGYAAADTVARQLEALFGAGGPAARGTRRWGGPEQSVRQTFRGGRDIAVVADAKLATLMVLADRETHAEIKKVLLNLDVKGAELELKYYPVAHAEPAQLAQTIGRLFKLPVGAEPASRRRFQPYEEMWMGARGEDGKVSDEPAVIPDRNLNALIVLAEGKTQELVAAALKDLDVAGPGERTIEHYRLKYARPETVAQQLLSLFNAGRRTSRAQQWGGGWSWGGWDGGARESRDAREEIVITSDAKIATLMVLADAETHAEIKKVLANLDVESVLLELKYYPITRATLRDIAQTVGRLFNLPVAAEAAPSGQFAPRRDGAAGAARGGLPEDPLIVPDANLNALIILADKKTHELIAPALLTLDVLSLIHISEPTRLLSISYAVFCSKKKQYLRHISEPPRPS